MFKKFATAKVTEVFNHRCKTASRKISGFDYEPRENCLYVAVRACTVDVPNLNFDMLPSYEVGEPKNAYKTFIGAYNYLNHDNQNPAKARGAIIDAIYHDDPDDKWVECLIEMDRDRCPKLCSLIESGEIDTVSMGTECERTICSVCGNVAEYPFQFCEHVQQKGRVYNGVLAYEVCEGLEFFELSWVYVPADPTAYTTALADISGDIECLHPYDHRAEEVNSSGVPVYGTSMDDELLFF